MPPLGKDLVLGSLAAETERKAYSVNDLTPVLALQAKLFPAVIWILVEQTMSPATELDNTQKCVCSSDESLLLSHLEGLKIQPTIQASREVGAGRAS